MDSPRDTLSKKERLCGKNAISSLLAKGKFVKIDNFTVCFTNNEADCNRIMISVSKKFFKRAVKRNLLKRRIRESYRRQKKNLFPNGLDMLFMYKSKDMRTYDEIYETISKIIEHINSHVTE